MDVQEEHPLKTHDYLFLTWEYGELSLRKDLSIHDGDLLLKRIACVAGESIKIEGRDHYCIHEDGSATHLGYAVPESQSGTPLPMNDFQGVIPDGFYFVSGDFDNSYDSKYFGLVRQNQIKSKLIAAF